MQRKLTRAKLVPCFEKLPRCRVGIEACATAHHWGRRLTELGHEVRLMPPSYVKPYLKGQKNDAADAEAICEAVTRPSMRFVEVKSPEQQSELVTLRTRMTLMRHRIELSNTIWAHMAEFDLAALIGLMGLQELIEILRDETDERVPPSARICLKLLTDQFGLVNRQALETDRLILASARATEVGRRLMAVPGLFSLCQGRGLGLAGCGVVGRRGLPQCQSSSRMRRAARRLLSQSRQASTRRRVRR